MRLGTARRECAGLLEALVMDSAILNDPSNKHYHSIVSLAHVPHHQRRRAWHARANVSSILTISLALVSMNP